MKKFILSTTLISVLIVIMVLSAFGQEPRQQAPETRKRAQVGMKFLSFSVDARAAGLADAITAEDIGSSTSMFYNPASMARLDKTFNVAVGQTQWIVDIDYNFATVAYKPADGKYGVFGLSLLAVDYGNIVETIRADTEQGFEDIGMFSPSALALGFGYAIALSDRFSVGANAKYVREELGKSALRRDDGGSLVREDNTTSTVAFDFGIVYRTGFRSLNFAMTARNFATDLTYAEESFELPLTLRIGFSMDMVDFTRLDKDTHSIMLLLDTERPRDFTEHVKVGVEYTFMNLVSFRGGIAAPRDEQGISLGAGIQKDLGQVAFNLNYAYTDFGVFDNINRFSIQFSF